MSLFGLVKSEEKQTPMCHECFFHNHDKKYDLQPDLIGGRGCQCPCGHGRVNA